MSQDKNLSAKAESADLAFSESAALTLNQNINQLVEIMPEHGKMLAAIKEDAPEIHRGMSLFHKTQSQFMDNQMTASKLTPLRNARQILAEINKVRLAISENTFKMEKKAIEAQIKEEEAEELRRQLKTTIVSSNSRTFSWLRSGKLKEESTASNHTKRMLELKIKMLETEINEIAVQSDATKGVISGAIRKLANYSEQYQSILAAYGKTEFTEADFEADEEKFHIMTAFDQAICAARSRNGIVDEGNMIYFTQMGINGAHAQHEILRYLNDEQRLLADVDPETGNYKAPTYTMYYKFLLRMAVAFKGSAKVVAEIKGMKPVTTTALLGKGDTRLLELAKDKKD